MTITLVRKPNWQTLYNDFMSSVIHNSYKIGEFDCGVPFVGSMIEAITGTDVVSKFRGKYNSDAEALALIEPYGSLADLVASILPEYDHPSEAKVGDIGVMEAPAPFGEALGIVNGERMFVLRPVGLGTVSFLSAKRAFRV